MGLKQENHVVGCLSTLCHTTPHLPGDSKLSASRCTALTYVLGVGSRPRLFGRITANEIKMLFRDRRFTGQRFYLVHLGSSKRDSVLCEGCTSYCSAAFFPIWVSLPRCSRIKLNLYLNLCLNTFYLFLHLVLDHRPK